MGFGKYAVIDNVRYSLKKEPDLWWEFKPPTAKEEVAINRFTQGDYIRTSINGIERKVRSNAEIALEELALTFGDTNIMDDDKRPILLPSDKMDKRREVIGTFPKELFYELWSALGEACPGWGSIIVLDEDGNETEDDDDEELEAGPKKEDTSSED